MRKRAEATAPAGVLLVDKPSGPTSHDVVNHVRRLTRTRRVGHTGTLDPFATGLMVLCLGRATRLARFFSEADKAYEATIRFGFATDTYDYTGKPIGPSVDVSLDEDEIARLLTSFVGTQEQRPPPFSAKKVGGIPLYRLARSGVAVNPSPVPIEIPEIRLLGTEGERARIAVSVSPGTYIRSLAHDIGAKLGTGAHLEALRRVRVGSLRVEDARTLSELERLAAEDGLLEQLLSPEDALRDLPEVRVGAGDSRKVRHGQALPWEELTFSSARPKAPQNCRVLGEDGSLLAVGRLEPAEELLRQVVVWSPATDEGTSL